jgi:hypothetical protein
MSRYLLLAQIVAVLSRRTPAFQPMPGQPQTFSEALRLLLRPHRAPVTPGGSVPEHGNDQQTLTTPSGRNFPDELAVRSAPEQEAPRDAVTNNPQRVATDDAPAGLPERSSLAQLADEFATWPAYERLIARVWLENPEMELVRHLFNVRGKTTALRGTLDRILVRTRALDFVLALDVVRDLDLDLDLAVDVARALTLDVALALDLTRTLDFDFARARARTLARDLVRALVRDLALARARAHAHALALARRRGHVGTRGRDLTFYLTRARVLDRALDHAHVLSQTLEFDSVLDERDRADADTFIRLRGSNLSEAVVLAIRQDIPIVEDATEAELGTVASTLTRLQAATRNMIDADLHDTDLRNIPLDGVRWSTGTHWPAGLQEWIKKHSDLIEPGLYEIQTRHGSNDRRTIPI